jgi:hypothetical protein
MFKFKLVFILLLLLVTLGPSQAQVSEPILAFQLAHDDAGYYMVCQQGCDYYNTLGTIEELNRRFPEYHCAVNWSYELRNRRRDAFSKLGYLVGPNGDTSNPLCG